MSKRAEVWRPLPDYEGRYEISCLGRIKNVKRNSIVKNYISPQGYVCCSLRLLGEKKSRTIRVHRAIARAFIPNPQGYPIINHKDGNKLNNSIENLEWCTYQHNIQHSFDNGLQTPSGQILEGDDYVKIFAMYKSGYLYSEIADALGGKVKERTIYFGLKRKSYLRWFSECEFQKRVEDMVSQLPQKKCYRNHKRINFNMSKRAKEAAMKAYPKEKDGSYRQFGCIKYDKYSEERSAFIQGYEQAEKDLADVAAFSSGPDGFYYGKGYQQGKKDAEKHLGWHSVDESLPPIDEEVIVLADELNTAPIYKIALGHIVDRMHCSDYNGWNIPGVKYWMPMPKLPKEEEK